MDAWNRKLEVLTENIDNKLTFNGLKKHNKSKVRPGVFTSANNSLLIFLTVFHYRMSAKQPLTPTTHTQITTKNILIFTCY